MLEMYASHNKLGQKMKTLLVVLLLSTIVLFLFSPASAEYYNNVDHLWPVYGHYSYSQNFAKHSYKAVDITADKYTSVKASIGGYVYSYYNGCKNEAGINTGNCSNKKICSPNHGTYEGFCNSGFGNGLIIHGDDGLYYQYAHLVLDSVPEKFRTNSIGAETIRVEKGEIIGQVGAAGCATGNHLHFEINTSGAFSGHINPEFNGGVIKYSTTMNGSLDVNGYLDGVSSGSLGEYGTFDIRVGTTTLNDVNDYFSALENGTSYEITDIKPNPGYEYTGKRSGELSGTIPSGETVEVSLGFARQGNLLIQGNLDGVIDNSISSYGTFDVYINDGEIIEENCTSYNKQWPRGTKFEVKNIRKLNGKNYPENGPFTFTGIIESNTQSKVVLYFTTDGTATTEWQEARVLPGNLNPDELDIEYKYHYEQIAESAPDSDWINAGLIKSEYWNVGGQYSSQTPLSTSDSRVFIENYYYHWCTSAKPAYANYEHTSIYVHYDQVQAPKSMFVESGERQNDNGYLWVFLNWTNGSKLSCRGGETCSDEHDYRNNRWYVGYIYQNRELHRFYKWTKDTNWVTSTQEGATSSVVRWRYRGGNPPIPPEEYVLKINGWLDSVQSDYLFDFGSFDLYADGELVAENCTGIEMTFDHNPVYSIENIRASIGKKFDGTHLGNLSGSIPSGNATVTLSFTTVMNIGENWTETTSLPEGIDLTGCDVEYKNHYVTTGRTSPGDEWSLYAEGAVQYENDGEAYESNQELTTSSTRVLLQTYFYHWCRADGKQNCNFYYDESRNYTHYDRINYDPTYMVMTYDKTEDGYTSYTVKWDNGSWMACKGGETCDSSHGYGSHYWYIRYVYQNKKPYQINTYVRESDWTSERDPQASYVSVRIRLKRYDVYLDGNGGVPSVELSKYYDNYLDLSEYIPEREDFFFTGWNTEADGTGSSYDSEFVYTENAPLVLFAQWTSITETILPYNTEIIEEEAFAGSGVRIVRIQSGCQRIHARAFADCSHLTKIYIPRSVTFIDSTAFDGVDSLIIVGDEDSIAELYAFKRDWITFRVEQ